MALWHMYRIDSHVMGFKHVPFAVGLDDPLFLFESSHFLGHHGTMAPWHHGMDACGLAAVALKLKISQDVFNLRISMCSSIF